MEPYYLLTKFEREIPKGNILDLGSGNGRNAIYLARNGFEVIAVDFKKEYLGKIEEISKQESLKISTRHDDIKSFKPKDKYSAILALNCLHFLKKSEREELIDTIKNSLIAEGLAFVSVFTTNDNNYKKFLESGKQPVEENTFYSNSTNSHWSFFNKGELKDKFSDFEILFYNENVIIEDSPEKHTHGIAEVVAKKNFI